MGQTKILGSMLMSSWPSAASTTRQGEGQQHDSAHMCAAEFIRAERRLCLLSQNEDFYSGQAFVCSVVESSSSPQLPTRTRHSECCTSAFASQDKSTWKRYRHGIGVKCFLHGSYRESASYCLQIGCPARRGEQILLLYLTCCNRRESTDLVRAPSKDHGCRIVLAIIGLLGHQYSLKLFFQPGDPRRSGHHA